VKRKTPGSKNMDDLAQIVGKMAKDNLKRTYSGSFYNKNDF
jgi:hypothetical protein